jgi:adenosylcobinamide kinase / adenosylcobinamide-phosphate guanylyltransferase
LEPTGYRRGKEVPFTKVGAVSSFLHFVLGGSRSGKSRHAEALAVASGMSVCFVATYATEMIDEEMRGRIAQHRSRRPSHWSTRENRFDLQNQVLESENTLLLVDSVTLWLSYHLMQRRTPETILADLEKSLQIARELGRAVILVSDEVGMGLVPLTQEGRIFCDLCGSANQLMTRYATKVEIIVAGLPWILKGGP